MARSSAPVFHPLLPARTKSTGQAPAIRDQASINRARFLRGSSVPRYRKYRSGKSLLSVLELALGFYFLLSIAFAVHARLYPAVPFLALFLFGFFYVGGLSLLQRATN